MSKTKIILIPLISLILLFSIFIGGVFAFKGKNFPVLRKVITIPFLEKNPEQVVELMMEEMTKIKSLSFDSNIKATIDITMPGMSMRNDHIAKLLLLELKNSSPTVLGIDNFSNDINPVQPNPMNFGGGFLEGPIKLNAKISGKYDNNDPENPKQEMTQDFSIAMGDMDLDFKLQIKSIDTIAYLKIDKLPAMLTMFIGDKLTNRWVKIDPEELMEQQEELPINMTNPLSTFQDPEKKKELEEKIINLSKELELIQITQRLEDEIIDEKKCYHYKINFNLDNLGEFYKRLFDTISEDIDLDDTEVNTSEELKEEIDKLKEMIKELETDIWIDKDNFYLRKTKINVKVLQEEGGNKNEININGYIDYSDFNEAIDISAPNKSESITDIIEEMFGGFMTDLTPSMGMEDDLLSDTKTPEIIIVDSDGDGLSDEEEMMDTTTNPNKADTDGDGLYDWEEAKIYSTNPLVADSDEDTYSDGSEVFKGYNPLGSNKIDSDSPEQFIINFRKNLGCDRDYNKTILYYDDDLFDDLKKSMGVLGGGLTIDEMKENIEITLLRIPENEIKQINFTYKEEIDNDKIKFKYNIIYKSDSNNDIIVNHEANLIKIDNKWKINAFTDALDELEIGKSLNSAELSSKSVRIIADIKQIQTALELYYIDAGNYPDSIYPNIESEDHTVYMGNIPKSTSNQGICSGYGEYIYELKEDGQSYTLTYCLLKTAAAIPQGVNIATPAGVTTKILKHKYCK